MGLDALTTDASVASRYLQRGAFFLAGKRLFDIVCGGLGLLVAAPLFLLIALAIKLDSPGPIFFRQQHVGRKRRLFSMWKFRKMPHDLPEQDPMLTARNDRRLTRVGHWLERSKLDELPQLLNVLASEMSLVGPRPEVPYKTGVLVATDGRHAGGDRGTTRVRYLPVMTIHPLIRTPRIRTTRARGWRS